MTSNKYILNFFDILKRLVKKIMKFLITNSTNATTKFIYWNIINTNIAYVKPHILKVKDNDYLIFENSENVFINSYNKKIKFKDLEQYLKMN